MLRKLKLLRSSGLDPFPLGKSLRGYNLRKAGADLRAAINVALLDFPQGMAYALIAGLPVQIGIFCSSLASLTGPLFASSRFVMLGPTNATAVMLLSTFLTLGLSTEEAVAVLPLLLVLVGCFMVLGALLRVAAITQFISRAVVIGYITAAAFLIIVNQLKTVFGLEVPRAGTFAESLFNLAKGLPMTDWQALGTGAGTLVIFMLLKRFLPKLPTVATTLVLVSIAVYYLRQTGFEVETLSAVRAANWPVTMPVFSWDAFNQMTQAALAITFLSLLESSSIAKTLAAQAGDRIDLNQQMLSMGAANFACAFGSGMTVSGSLTRSVLNYQSGAQTALASMMSGSLLIGGLFLLGGLIQFIPKAALAALVIMVGVSLIHRENIRVMLLSTGGDAMVFLTTFLSGLIMPLDRAIYLGAAASLLFFVRKAARPALKEMVFDDSGTFREQTETGPKRPELVIVHVEGDLFFASSDLFLEQMRRLAEHPEQRAIILRLRNAYHLDATVALTLKELITFVRKNDCEIFVSGAQEEVEEIFERSGLMEQLGRENFFRHDPANPNLSTRDALKRAQEVTGITSADITLYAADRKNEGR